MASIINVPVPNKEPRQKSIDISDLFLTRFTPPWSRPSSLPANVWRGWVLNQSVAVVCRETLIANLLALDWKITPVNSKYKEELDPTIKYYTKLFKDGGNYAGLGLDFSGLIEWIVGDLLDIPFGGAAEIGRKGDEEKGRVQWIRPIDGGTLFPTLNQDFPIVQYYPSYSTDVVVFKPWEISRMFMSPHSNILREGWGMAPPEKVYFALDLLTKGDKYYANLLLDIPTAGILDLGDMEKSSAEEWITAFKSFVNDTTTSFKIPVLYEHNNKVEFIPFGKVPNDIMFNHITLKYAALVAAAYGMSLSDIGLGTTSASGETLAGSIRQERRTRKTGFARIKAKTKAFFDHILPEMLEFNWIDYDDELNVALGRARLASAQAFMTWQDKGVLSPQEVRSQIIQDGLVSISLPDEIPPDAKPLAPTGAFGQKVGGNTEPELIGNPKAPSAGGEGDVKKSIDTVSFKPKARTLNTFISDIILAAAPKINDALSALGEDEVSVMKSMITDSAFDEEDSLEFAHVFSPILADKTLGTFDFGNLESEIEQWLGDGVQVDVHKLATTLKSNIRSGVTDFIGKAVLFTMMQYDDFSNMENLIQNVSSAVNKSLYEYISAHVGIELQNVLENVEKSNALPEPVRMKSLGKPIKEQIQNINVTVPERSTQVTLSVPPQENKNEITVNVPQQEPPIVNLAAPIVNIEQEQPDIIVNVPEQKSTIQVNVPEQSSVINVNVPEQSAPVVNVNVEPTPLEVKNIVNVPDKKDKKKITLRKDGNTWTGEAT